MTKEELIISTRNLVNEISTDSGAFLANTGNVSDFLNDAAEIVVLDLVEFMPERFLTYEDITLVAGTAGYTLTAEWLQIWSINRNKTSETPTPIDHIPVPQIMNTMYVGETAEEPDGWYLKGLTITFAPTPSKAYTNYARAWIIAPEAATIATNGPTMIPRVAHRAICYMAAVLIGTALEADVTRFEKLYSYRIKKIRDTIGVQVQNQPRFINPSVLDRKYITTRDKVLYDLDPYFRG